MLQVCVDVEHVVVLVALRIRVINSVVVNVPTYSRLPVLEFLVNCSHCENGSFEVLSLHPRRLQQTAVSCKRSICNKIKWTHESHLSEVLPKICRQRVASFYREPLHASSFIDFL